MTLTPRMIEGMEYAKKKTRLPLKHIAMVSGITYRTLRKWLKDGEEYKQQIEEGEIKKGDLTTKQKREIELFEKMCVGSVDRVGTYMDKIYDYAVKHEDIKGLQWLLKIEDPIFRDGYVDSEGLETEVDSNEVVVVTLAACGKQSARLLSDFVNGSVKNGEEKNGHSEDSEGSGG